MTVGERIKTRRNELGLTASEVAEAAGISRSTLFRYERNAIERLPLNALAPIAVALQTTVGYLMGWANENALTSGDESIEEMNLIIDRLSEAKKREALRYLRYLASDEGK